ncbi:MAG: hypothetical protein IT473_06635 [Lysobacter sp.]|nr:hypothetical protein [Lysobacter sp.]
MSDWFDDADARPGAKKPVRSGNHQNKITMRQVNDASDRRLPGVPDPVQAGNLDWNIGSPPAPEHEDHRMGQLVASAGDDEASGDFSDHDYAEASSSEDSEPEGGEADTAT